MSRDITSETKLETKTYGRGQRFVKNLLKISGP
jgi:hypothetical protein